MRDNNESWALFQLFDEMTERWSPVYCSPSILAARMEVKELSKKQPNRVLIFRVLGIIMDGSFEPVGSGDEKFGNPEGTDEISAARSDV